MHIWIFKKETQAYKDFMHNFTYVDGWNKCKEEIKSFLGIKGLEALTTNINRLILLEVPEHLAEQFTKGKQDGNGQVYFAAKQRSKIDKAWKEFCKEHKLEDFNTYVWWSYDIATYSGKKIGDKTKVERINDDLFMTCEGDGSYFDTVDWLEKFNTAEYYRLKAAHEEKKSNKQF